MNNQLKTFFRIIVPIVLIGELIQSIRYFIKGDAVGGIIAAVVLVVFSIVAWQFLLRESTKKE
ncbi:hypothetical protein ACFL0L_05150 [Patescibacteria group bacterium]